MIITGVRHDPLTVAEDKRSRLGNLARAAALGLTVLTACASTTSVIVPSEHSHIHPGPNAHLDFFTFRNIEKGNLVLSIPISDRECIKIHIRELKKDRVRFTFTSSQGQKPETLTAIGVGVTYELGSDRKARVVFREGDVEKTINAEIIVSEGCNNCLE